MPLTRLFKSGDSQTVRIPAELAYADVSADFEIMRTGDVIIVFPAPKNLKEAAAILRDLPKPTEVEAREAIDLPERRGN